MTDYAKYGTVSTHHVSRPFHSHELETIFIVQDDIASNLIVHQPWHPTLLHPKP